MLDNQMRLGHIKAYKDGRFLNVRTRTIYPDRFRCGYFAFIKKNSIHLVVFIKNKKGKGGSFVITHKYHIKFIKIKTCTTPTIVKIINTIKLSIS